MSVRVEAAPALDVRRRTRAAVRARPWLLTLLAGVLLAAATGFDELRRLPTAGLDPSWNAGLHMAAHDGLDFGPDVLFTYGPLGFLKVPVYWYGSTGFAAFVYYVLTHVGLAVALLLTLRRSYGIWGAVLVTLVVAPVVVEPTPVIAFCAGAWLLTREDDRPWSAGDPWPTDRIVALALGALAGIELLGKVNTGVVVTAVAATALLFRPRRVALLGLFAAAAAVAFLAGWLLTGQPLGALSDYARGVARIVSGYSNAMGLEQAQRVWEYGAALVVALAGIAAAWAVGLGPRRDARFGLAAMWLVLAFLEFKQGFVRHDTHALFFFGLTAGALCAFPWRSGMRAAGLAIIALGFVAYLGVGGLKLTNVVDPVGRIGDTVDAVRVAFSPDERAARMREGRASIVATEPLPARVLAAVRGRTVAAWPTETAAVWAYGLRWRPLPVFQGYQAYTEGLDATDAALLRDDRRAPERILYRPLGGSVDARILSFDTPQTAREMLCRYVPAARGGGWLALARVPDRCGPPRLVGSQRVAWKQSVATPAPTMPDGLVFARVAGLRPTGLGPRLRALFYKGQDRVVEVDGTLHKMIAAVAGGGLPLAAARGVDYPPPFNIASGGRTFAFGRAGDTPAGTPLRIDFYEMEVRPAR